MNNRSSASVSRFAVPAGRDPFVNTPLLALGNGPDGEERFWISSYNSNVGCLGVMVTESGKERIYRFASFHRGFYGAAQEDADTLWLCGDLSCVVRLSLSTGNYETYETGAPPALVFQGLRFDPATRKLFAATYVRGVKTIGFSFDCEARKAVRIHEPDCPANYTRGSFPNGDGTYSLLVAIPDLVLLHWNPCQETVQSITLGKAADLTGDKDNLLYGSLQKLISDDSGKTYIPHLGWYDGVLHEFSKEGPRPSREAVWFGRRDNLVWGLTSEDSNDSSRKTLIRWNTATDRVECLCTISDTGHANACLTKKGKIVIVTMYGEFLRIDGATGALELAKRLPTDSIARVDCLVRIDRDRLLGTPFITQRFWEIDLKKGSGYDCGRAAPGSGQIVKVWEVSGLIYMAAYTGGELLEYDPDMHPHFPENPRVVADPPGGMRPVAATHDATSLYYSCSLKYGRTGSVLTKYNTQTREAVYQEPMASQMICSLHFDAETSLLIAGTTMHADCQSGDPDALRCYLALLDTNDLSLVEKAVGPEGAEMIVVVGSLGKGDYLCSVSQKRGDEVVKRWFATSVKHLNVPDFSAMKSFPEHMEDLLWAGKPGLFVLRVETRYELWDMRQEKILRTLFDRRDEAVYGWHVQDDTLYLITPREIIVLEDCLKN